LGRDCITADAAKPIRTPIITEASETPTNCSTITTRPRKLFTSAEALEVMDANVLGSQWAPKLQTGNGDKGHSKKLIYNRSMQNALEQHDGHGVIENRLAEYQRVQHFVTVELWRPHDRQCGHRIH
jgi:hypothetical protein